METIYRKNKNDEQFFAIVCSANDSKMMMVVDHKGFSLVEVYDSKAGLMKFAKDDSFCETITKQQFEDAGLSVMKQIAGIARLIK